MARVPSRDARLLWGSYASIYLGSRKPAAIKN
jgi:hypothetical protein